MKKILITLLSVLCLCAVESTATEMSPTIAISAVVPEYANIPEEVRLLLENKLQQMITLCNFGCSEGNRFVMTAKVNILEKDINSAGFFMHKMEVTFFIGDVVEDRIYGSCSINVVGLEATEEKSFIKAFRSIKSSNPAVREMLMKANAEIINYYSNKCDFEINEAQSKADLGQYEEAIQKLMLVPNVDTVCYRACRNKVMDIYNQMAQAQAIEDAAQAAAIQAAIDKEGKTLIQKAKAAWHVKQDYEGAAEALSILASIDVDAACFDEANKFIEEISNKLRTDERKQAAAAAAAAKAAWDFKVRQYEDRHALDVQKQADKAAVLNMLAGRFGKIDIGIQRETTKRWGRAK